MPAPAYPTVRVTAAAAASSSSRSFGPTAGDGVSSITFWYLRWTEQSRSVSAHTEPRVSASTWTSTWRAPVTSGSQKMVGSPNADWASRRAASSAAGSSAALLTTRMPRPPPPPDALTSTGKELTDSGSSIGSTGTPAPAASRFERDL